MRHRSRLQSLAFLLSVSPISMLAQQVPEGWRSHPDRAAANVFKGDLPAGAFRFQEMIPGMHVTTGPGLTAVAPRGEATGRYMVEAEMLLFPDSQDRGYGVFVGGQIDAKHAEQPVTNWTAFLVAGDGKFAIVKRNAGQSAMLVDWTAHDAIVVRGKDVVTNRLRASVERDSVRFHVNGKQVAAVSRMSANPDGLFGLRFDEGVNLHITNVDFVNRLLKR